MNAQRLGTSHLVRLFDGGSLSGLSEWQLLERYVVHRDELAFQLIVTRHGPMVLGICRRMLENPADVDDAFQATFLVLLQRAGSLGPNDTIAGWLHGVAVRVARQARHTARRRSRRELGGIAIEPVSPEPPADDPDLRRILDEEIHRLPSKYRVPIILCYLEGQTHQEASRQLQWPLGTVKGRLARARSLLESRLARRGVAGGATLAALAADSLAEAAVPPALVAATCAAAARISSGALLTHVVSASVAHLSQGAITTMFIHKLKLIAGACVVSGLFLTSAGVLARQATGPQAVDLPREAADRPDPGGEPEHKPGAASAPLAQPTEKPAFAAGPTVQPRMDVQTSAEALYRQLIEGARRAFNASQEDYNKGHSPLQRVYQASKLLMESERDVATQQAEKLRALENHLDRIQKLARYHADEGNADDANGAEAKAYLAEAQLLLAQAKTPKAASPASSGPAPRGTAQGPGEDPRSRAILARLEQPIAMSFANETPLEDVIKYLKQATTGPNESGIPIYVDPLGLQEAEKTLTSPVSIDLEGIPLRRTLQLVLRPLGLGYFVQDGILVITSIDGEDNGLQPEQIGPSPFEKKQQKLERGELTMQEMRDFATELKLQSEIMKQIGVLHELQRRDERGVGDTPGVKPDRVTALLSEFKNLLQEMRSDRQKSRSSEAK